MKLNKLSSFHLRLIGMLTMAIDHVGYFLFPRLLILRIIGRISFPIFALLCAEAMHYSSKKGRYIIVLSIFDIVISLFIYMGTGANNGTIFSTLAISSLIILLLQNKRKIIKFLAIIPLMYAIFASLNFTPVVMQYGIYGVIMIVGFYLIRKFFTSFYNSHFGEVNDDKFNFTFYYSLLCVIYLLTLSIIAYYSHTFLETYLPCGGMDYRIQGNAIIAGAFIIFYSGKKGYSSKWFRIFSYAFYSAHILIILLIQLIMHMI